MSTTAVQEVKGVAPTQATKDNAADMLTAWVVARNARAALTKANRQVTSNLRESAENFAPFATALSVAAAALFEAIAVLKVFPRNTTCKGGASYDLVLANVAGNMPKREQEAIILRSCNQHGVAVA
jgi:hypothetical protein